MINKHSFQRNEGTKSLKQRQENYYQGNNNLEANPTLLGLKRNLNSMGLQRNLKNVKNKNGNIHRAFRFQ